MLPRGTQRVYTGLMKAIKRLYVYQSELFPAVGAARHRPSERSPLEAFLFCVSSELPFFVSLRHVDHFVPFHRDCYRAIGLGGSRQLCAVEIVSEEVTYPDWSIAVTICEHLRGRGSAGARLLRPVPADGRINFNHSSPHTSMTRDLPFPLVQCRHRSGEQHSQSMSDA